MDIFHRDITIFNVIIQLYFAACITGNGNVSIFAVNRIIKGYRTAVGCRNRQVGIISIHRGVIIIDFVAFEQSLFVCAVGGDG